MGEANMLGKSQWNQWKVSKGWSVSLSYSTICNMFTQILSPTEFDGAASQQV